VLEDSIVLIGEGLGMRDGRHWHRDEGCRIEEKTRGYESSSIEVSGSTPSDSPSLLGPIKRCDEVGVVAMMTRGRR
jgi:hypothetical protein